MTEQSAHGKTRILLVEDEAPIRKLIRAAIDPDGHVITETRSGEEALKVLEEQRFDLLILDLTLEGSMTGWDLLDAMRTNRLLEGVRVMILTARSAERDILRGWRSGVDQYCMKPFEPSDFVKRVEDLLASTEQELARHRQSELERTQLLHLVDNAFDGT